MNVQITGYPGPWLLSQKYLDPILHRFREGPTGDEGDQEHQRRPTEDKRRLAQRGVCHRWRPCRPTLDIEATVDWDRMGPAVAALSPGGYRGQRVDATEQQIRQAAPTLVGATHYRKADKPVPDTLAALT